MRRRVGEGGQELLAASRGAPARFYKEQILRGHHRQISMPLAHSLLGPLSPGWRAIGYREGRGQGEGTGARERMVQSLGQAQSLEEVGRKG